MAALGLVLLVLSGVFTLGVVLSNTDPVPKAEAFGVSLSNVSLGGLFLAGAIAGLIFGIGLGLMVAGAARKRHRRVQTKQTIKGNRSEKEQLAAENDELRSRLAAAPVESGRNDANSYAGSESRADGSLHDGSRTDGTRHESRRDGVPTDESRAAGTLNDDTRSSDTENHGRRGVFGRK